LAQTSQKPEDFYAMGFYLREPPECNGGKTPPTAP